MIRRSIHSILTRCCVGNTLASLACALLLSVGLGSSKLAFAAEVSFFRKAGGAALNDRHPLPEELGSPENLMWRQAVGPGHSTPCVHGDSIYLTSFDEGNKQLATVALDRATGAIKWTRNAPIEKLEPFHSVGSPASCTPACDGERVYSFFGSFGLLCYDLQGNHVWSKPMGPFQDEFGANSSPVLVDGKVILNEDHDINSFLMAIDATTGETIWRSDREGFTRSYSTPIIIDVDGRKQIVVAGALQLVAYDVNDGRKLWWVSGLSRIVDTTPLVQDGTIYVATWTPGGDQTDRIAMESFPDALNLYDDNENRRIEKSELPEGPVLTRFFRIDLDQNGALDADEWQKHAVVFEQAQNVALAIDASGSGDVTDTHVKWIHRRGLPTVPSPLVYRGVFYMVKDGGIITSLDAETGEVLKQGRARGRGNYYASPVAGDGKVYLASQRGVITVLLADGNWSIVSSHDFGEPIMATPVISHGHLYVRTEKALYCFSKRADSLR